MTKLVIYSGTYEKLERRAPRSRTVIVRRDAHDDPYGLGLDAAHVDGIAFINPYRSIGELNETELMKLRRHPFEVAAAIINTYAKDGLDALNAIPGEVERLKWVGVYPQRQGGDSFMMRVKVPGGVLTSAQAREIGLAAEAYGRGPEDHPLFGNGYCDITTRQTVQLHWLHMADIPRIWERFARVGLTSVQACGDCARNVTSCPVSGVDPHELVDSLGVATAISDFFTGNREYANLPRKFKISVSGCSENCSRVEINDIGLWPASLGGDVGFNVLVGGGLSDGERLGTDIDLFITPEQAVETTRATAQLYAELGNREHRGVARMRYLVQELGGDGFRNELVARLKFEARSGATTMSTGYRRDHVGVHPQVDEGLFYVGCVVPAGRLVGLELVEAARLADVFGDGHVRLGVDQNFVLSGVAEARLTALLDEPLMKKFSPNAGPFTRGVVACTGNEFCRYAITETKQRAVQLAKRLDARIDELSPESPLRTTPLRVHLSGCSASCAQPQIADIGLRGSIHKNDFKLEEAYDVGMGGALGPEAGFIDWVEGAVPVRQLEDAVMSVAVAYDQQRLEGETFTAWSRRVDPNQLRDVVNGRSS
jgi:ferredoxin-nitrite reductase